MIWRFRGILERNGNGSSISQYHHTGGCHAGKSRDMRREYFGTSQTHAKGKRGADETAQRTFRTADASGKLSLCDLSGFHQVLYAVTDFTGEIYVFIAHVPHLFALFTVSFSHCYLRYSSFRVFPSLFFHSIHPLVLPPSTNMAAELGEVNGTETFSMYLLPLRRMSPF